MYDWANSAFQSTVITAVFPPFFSAYAAAGLPPAVATARFAWATTIAVTITAILGPILGAIADYRAIKKRMLAVFLGIGVITTMMMGTINGSISSVRRYFIDQCEPCWMPYAAAIPSGVAISAAHTEAVSVTRAASIHAGLSKNE